MNPTSLLRLATVFLLASIAPAQSSYFWSQSIDGPGARDDQIRDLVVGPQGRIFVAAASEGLTDTDGVVTCFDAFGQVVWNQRVDLGGTEYMNDLQYDAISGDLFVIGGAGPTGGAGHWTVFRLSAQSGAIAWRYDYFGPLNQGGLAMSMDVDAAGGVVVGGYVGTPQVHESAVIRLDASGVRTWEWLHSSPSGQGSHCARITADPSGDVTVLIGDYQVATYGTLYRLTSAGTPTWNRPLGLMDNGLLGPKLDSSANLVYAINAQGGGHIVEKLGVTGNSIWSISTSTLFGNSSIFSIAIAPGDDVVVTAADCKIARLDGNGNVLWLRGLPPVGWFDEFAATSSGLVVASNGDAVMRMRGHTPVSSLDFDSVASWDAGGNFLWSQAVRSFEPDVEVQTLGLALAPQGSVVIGGYSQKVGAFKDMFIAAVHQASHFTCFGDGSAGACPCGNNVPAGTPSGCRSSMGIGARLDDQGISSLGNDSLRFYATGVPFGPGVAVLLQGQPSLTPLSFQDGRMCLQAPLLRVYASATNPPGGLDLAPAGGLRVHARSAALGDVIQPGTSRAYQLYYRGSARVCQPGNGNLTNAVVVDWAP